MTRRLITLLVVLLAVRGLAAAESPSAPAKSARRAILIGLDGLDPQLVERLGSARLPNLAGRLHRPPQGRLMPTTPAESPVSWATMITGLDPGETGIYDFLYHARRAEDGTTPPGWQVRPLYALVDIGEETIMPPARRWQIAAVIGPIVALIVGLLGWWWIRRPLVALVVALLAGAAAVVATAALLAAWVPERVPAPVGRRRGVPFWERAAETGLRVRALTVPMTFPATACAECPCLVLAGLGVPDVRGTNGTYQVWTSRASAARVGEFGGLVRPLARPEARTTIRVEGGRDPLHPSEYLALEVALERDADGGLRLRVPGNDAIAVRPGAWSPPLAFEFRASPLARIIGLSRFRLMADDANEFTLYLAPIAFHPAHAPAFLGLSHPHEFAAYLARETTPFSTLGWGVDTWGLADGFLDEPAFIADLERSFAERAALVRHALAHDEHWDVLVAVLEETDRASHMLWRHLDTPADVPDAGRDALIACYERADALVGEVLDHAASDPDTLVLVVSDHGFARFDRGVNLNAWLIEQGYMVRDAAPDARLSMSDLFGDAAFFPGVEWGRTRAFALGLGLIYVNQHGLDPLPAVAPSAAEAVAAEIAARLDALEDPQAPGVDVVASVAYKRVDPATGEVILVDRRTPHLRLSGWNREAPEIVVGFAPGYRVSWQTTLGGIGATIFEDNTNAWCGDHCSVDAASVAGYLGANLALGEFQDPHVRDIAPTLLAWLGVPVPPELSGRVLLPPR